MPRPLAGSTGAGGACVVDVVPVVLVVLVVLVLVGAGQSPSMRLGAALVGRARAATRG